MTDTTEETTRWIEVWVVNDEEYLSGAQDAAGQGPDALRHYIEHALADAPTESGAWHIAREMTPSDYESVDWVEVAETVLG